MSNLKNVFSFAIALTLHYLCNMGEKEDIRMNRREWIRCSATGLAGIVGAVSFSGCDKRVPARLEGTFTFPEKIRAIPSFSIPNIYDELPKLGISTTSFPKTGKKYNHTECHKLLSFAIGHGIRLFDTTWAMGEGDGEKLLGEAMQGKQRANYRLSTSMPTWDIHSKDEAEGIFQQQLDLLQTDCIDYYALQAINSTDKFHSVYKESGVLAFLLRQKKEGRIRQLGIELIGDEATSMNLLETEHGFFDFAKIPYNAIDNLRMGGSQARIIAEAESHGLATFAMNPTKDGTMRMMNGNATDILLDAYPNMPIAGWALRDAASTKGASLVIDSPQSLQELKEDLSVFSEAIPFNASETKTWKSALDSYLRNAEIGCTYCNACMPCPYGLDIPGIFKVYNTTLEEDMLPDIFGNVYSEGFERRGIYFSNRYKKTVKGIRNALQCTGCGRCLPRCPQRIAIPAQMGHIAAIIETVHNVATDKICNF